MELQLIITVVEQTAIHTCVDYAIFVREATDTQLS